MKISQNYTDNAFTITNKNVIDCLNISNLPSDSALLEIKKKLHHEYVITLRLISQRAEIK